MRLPKVIYEIYPMLYIISGVFAMITLHAVVPFLSGLLLCVSGIVILYMRRNYRLGSGASQYQHRTHNHLI